MKIEDLINRIDDHLGTNSHIKLDPALNGTQLLKEAKEKLLALESAINEYYDANNATNQCTALCMSDPYRGVEAAEIMQGMYHAESDMFAVVGINYHGGTNSGLREADDVESSD